MSGCIFCKLATNEISSAKVYEDDEFIAFLDIKPISLGHTLVIPKQHYENLESVPFEVAGKFFQIVQKVAKAVARATGVEGFNLGINNGKVAGQVIFHVHMHIMPRRADDGLKLWPECELAAGEIESIALKIKQTLTL
jgi:histidine triad (HIT) family protein